MEQVPNIISTKDLSYISDMLNWIHTFSKKIYHYETIAEDESVINILEKSNNILINIYNDLLNTLNWKE